MADPTPMEPMDSYLCILLDLKVINSSTQYTQAQICSYVAQNQTYINDIMSDPPALAAIRNQYLTEAQSIVVLNKAEDCGD